MPARQTPRFDFWNFAQGTEPTLAIGRSGIDDVALLLRLRRQKMKMKPPAINLPPGCEIGDFYFQFTADGVLHGVNYGYRPGDDLTADVLAAFAAEQGVPLPEIPFEPGELDIALNGRPLSGIATIQGVIGAIGSIQDFRMSGRDYDKWICLSCETDVATVKLDFLLKTVKASYSPSFRIDYCLYGISVMSNTTLVAEA
ncbi:hypothetical protein DEM27_06145 [Metarhizobium album]|uniref:Uncharacterized protein n=1 Tax=Metarhizobium album TaxID=2182425 RepID=A0A2U2DV92_9HYPH|nr:hypothetical protein [Rhizobium album]PWE57217.1 hypothetical protein DEM27_06145 [Rhizobium album]